MDMHSFDRLAVAALQGVDFHSVDYAGRDYREFFPARAPATGPGWYVFGLNRDHYAPGGIVHLCARPDVAARAHPHYNIRVRRGWQTRREAQAIADHLNSFGA